MDAINVIIVIFVFMNVIVNIFWDGIIAFDYFEWVDKLCGNWEELKKHFIVNQCERWISSINFCLMTIFGILLIISIVHSTPSGQLVGGGLSYHWVYALSLCYVLSRLILVSATLLTTNLNEKWLSVIPGVAFQVFVLGLIITSYGSKVFSENGEKIAIISFIVSILLTLILPFIILRVVPTKETETDINFNISFNKTS